MDYCRWPDSAQVEHDQLARVWSREVGGQHARRLCGLQEHGAPGEPCWRQKLLESRNTEWSLFFAGDSVAGAKPKVPARSKEGGVRPLAATPPRQPRPTSALLPADAYCAIVRSAPKLSLVAGHGTGCGTQGHADTRVIRHLFHRLQAVCAARNVKMQCTQNSCGSIHNRNITPMAGGKYNMINFNWWNKIPDYVYLRFYWFKRAQDNNQICVISQKTSQELRMLSRSLSDCKSLLLNVMI